MKLYFPLVVFVFFLSVSCESRPLRPGETLLYSGVNERIAVDSSKRVFFKNGQPFIEPSGNMFYPNGKPLRKVPVLFGKTKMFYPNGKILMNYGYRLLFHNPVNGRSMALFDGGAWRWPNENLLMHPNFSATRKVLHPNGVNAWDGKQFFDRAGEPMPIGESTYSSYPIGPWGYMGLTLYQNVGDKKPHFAFEGAIRVLPVDYVYPFYFAGEDKFITDALQDFVVTIDTGNGFEQVKVWIKKRGQMEIFVEDSPGGPYPKACDKQLASGLLENRTYSVQEMTRFLYNARVNARISK